MSEMKQCAFCGKTISDEENICSECKDHMDHQYTTDFLDDNDNNGLSQKIIESEDIEAISEPEEEPEAIDEAESVPSTEEPKRSSKVSKGIIFLIVGSVILVVIGIIGALNIAQTRKSEAAQEAYWMKCVEENTPLSYSKYLVQYPEGTFADEAEKRIRYFREEEIKAWEKLKKSSDINAFYAYLSENPETPHMDQIRLIMDSLSWISTIKDNTAEAYKAYMENVNLGNIAGQHMDEAKEKYDYLSQIIYLNGASLESFKLDLVDFLKKLSDNNPKDLLKKFSPKTFYYTAETNSTDIVASISKKYTDEKIKKITYTLKPESLLAKQDNKGVIFAEFSIEQEIVYNVRKKKNDKQTQNLLLEMNKEKQVQSIKLKK